MPATDSPAVIVARFLKANHYTETYEAFVQEARLPNDAGSTRPGDWTIEQILEEKKKYDVSLIFEKKTGENTHGWRLPGKRLLGRISVEIGRRFSLYICNSGISIWPQEGNKKGSPLNETNATVAPSHAFEIPSIPATSNVLCVRGGRPTSGGEPWSSLFVAFADRSLIEISSSPPYQRFTDVASLHNGPILSVYPLQEGRALTTSMSGQLIVHEPRSFSSSTDVEILVRRSDHSKYAVQVAATNGTSSRRIIATAGWDQKVHIYANSDTEARGSQPAATTELLRDPAATISLQTNPESFVFVRHPDTEAIYLVLSRRDSTYLYYYLIDPNPTSITVREAGKQNLAPHANAWIAFSPSCLALSPKDPTLLAVATSHLPHMKLIIVRLLFPDTANLALIGGHLPPPVTTQASQARAALAVSDREDVAISLHVSTMAPQTPYSTPQVVWRPDGSGVWVNGDDGVVRGVEVVTGKVVAKLKGHEPGTKVRSLWSGIMRLKDEVGEVVEEAETDRMKEEEWLVSGGFDKKVIVWRIGDQEAVADT